MQTILEGESSSNGIRGICDWCVSASYSSDDEIYCGLRREHMKRGTGACVAYIREIGADDDIGELGMAYRE